MLPYRVKLLVYDTSLIIVQQYLDVVPTDVYMTVGQLKVIGTGGRYDSSVISSELFRISGVISADNVIVTQPAFLVHYVYLNLRAVFTVDSPFDSIYNPFNGNIIGGGPHIEEEIPFSFLF